MGVGCLTAGRAKQVWGFLVHEMLDVLRMGGFSACKAEAWLPCKRAEERPICYGLEAAGLGLLRGCKNNKDGPPKKTRIGPWALKEKKKKP